MIMPKLCGNYIRVHEKGLFITFVGRFFSSLLEGWEIKMKERYSLVLSLKEVRYVN